MEPGSGFGRLRAACKRLAPLGEAELDGLEGLFSVRRLDKGAFLLKPGARPSHFFFVASGLLRYFVRGRAGKEFNKAFLAEGQFSSPQAVCPVDGKSECGVQALEPAEVLAADLAAFNALYDRHPAFERLGRRLLEEWVVRREGSVRGLFLEDAGERYLAFLDRHADLAQRVPQYHIASYLGINEVSLSRIRGNLARRPVRPALPVTSA